MAAHVFDFVYHVTIWKGDGGQHGLGSRSRHAITVCCTHTQTVRRWALFLQVYRRAGHRARGAHPGAE